MDAEQVLAFRLARSGLASRGSRTPVDAAACPASDFSRDAALIALAARVDGLTRDGYAAAVDAGEVIVAHAIRGAIHALAGGDHALFGRALIAREDGELAAQLGHQVERLVADGRFAPLEALEEVASVTRDVMAGGRRLDRNELHEEWRQRVRGDLMPWCEGCGSYHVAPMLWRYATVEAGVRLDSERRYVQGDAGGSASGADAVRHFLRFYGPAAPGDFADWAGVVKPHARRLWDDVAGDLAEVQAGKTKGWLLRDDEPALESPPAAAGIRLIPPGDPYLQKPNRALLTPDPALRKRLFRPVGSPGAVLRDGRLVGLWRARLKGRKAEVSIEPLERLRQGELETESQRLAELRGAATCALVLT